MGEVRLDFVQAHHKVTRSNEASCIIEGVPLWTDHARDGARSRYSNEEACMTTIFAGGCPSPMEHLHDYDLGDVLDRDEVPCRETGSQNDSIRAWRHAPCTTYCGTLGGHQELS